MTNFFIAVMKMLGTETVRTTAYHPQTNRQVERYNRTMATQLRHYVADDPSRWDELLPVITMAYHSQPHRSTGIAPFELVIPRRVPNLTIRNLPPGTSLSNKGTLKDGSPQARKREFMAGLRKQPPVVVEVLRKTQQRYKRNIDHRVAIRGCHGYITEEYIHALYPYPLRIRAGDAYSKCIMRKRGEDISILSDKNCKIISDPYSRYERRDTGIYKINKLLGPTEFRYNAVHLSFPNPTIGRFMCNHVAATSGNPARPGRNRSST